MEVDDDRHADQAQRQGGEHQHVGDRVDLDQGVAPATMRARQGPAGPGEEVRVLEEVRADPRALVALDVEPVDADAGDDARGLVAVAPEREHVHLAPGGAHGLRLAADPGVLLVVGVDDHGDRTALRHGDLIDVPFGAGPSRAPVAG